MAAYDPEWRILRALAVARQRGDAVEAMDLERELAKRSDPPW